MFLESQELRTAPAAEGRTGSKIAEPFHLYVHTLLTCVSPDKKCTSDRTCKLQSSACQLASQPVCLPLLRLLRLPLLLLLVHFSARLTSLKGQFQVLLATSAPARTTERRRNCNKRLICPSNSPSPSPSTFPSTVHLQLPVLLHLLLRLARRLSSRSNAIDCSLMLNEKVGRTRNLQPMRKLTIGQKMCAQ